MRSRSVKKTVGRRPRALRRQAFQRWNVPRLPYDHATTPAQRHPPPPAADGAAPHVAPAGASSSSSKRAATPPAGLPKDEKGSLRLEKPKPKPRPPPSRRRTS